VQLWFLGIWTRRAERRRQVQAVNVALDAVHATALERPLPADRLEDALRGAVAAGASRMQAAKVAGIGASEFNLADVEHRQRVHDIVRRVVHIVPSWVGG
jgi:hypothetical protein